ncbi:MAG: trypsin-like serine protease [Gammaproteobacteria bacterium]|nr:trypsin-like serine protease [Gammaproteobacteria bacterium]
MLRKSAIFIGLFTVFISPLHALTVSESDLATPAANATVQVINPVLSGLCTGTLIQQDIVLTASHCMNGLTPVSNWGWQRMPAGMNITIGVGVNGSNLLSRRAVSHYNHAGFEDIILLGLSTRIPVEMAKPVPVLYEMSPDEPLRWLTSPILRMAGWGFTETGPTNIRRTADAHYFIAPYINPEGVFQPNMWRAVSNDGSEVRGGDSGGPLYWTSRLEDKTYVIGSLQRQAFAGGAYVMTFGRGGNDSTGATHPNVSSWLQRNTRSRMCDQFNNYSANSPLPSLLSWWSNERLDNFATTSSGWFGCLGDTKTSGDATYRHYRVEGRLLARNVREDGTLVALHRWYSPSRGDNFTTSDPSWAGISGDTRWGYVFARKEGYVFSPNLPQPSGTLPLYSWYHPDRGDNFITTDPNWRGSYIGQTRLGYRYFRLEGYVLTP